MDTALNTLKYWYMEEFLLPQEIDTPKKMKRSNPKLFVERGDFKTILNALFQKVEDNKNSVNADWKWEFTFYGGMFKVDNIRDRLEKAIPDLKFSGFEERTPSGYAASYMLTFSSEGVYKSESLQISTAPWAVKKIVESKKLPFLPLDVFESELEKLNESIDLISEEMKPFNVEKFILASGKDIKEFIGDALLNVSEAPVFQLVAVKKKVKKQSSGATDDANFLNSFYLSDLYKAIDKYASVKSDATLFEYLNVEKDTERIDVRDASNDNRVKKMLYPAMLPDGCWPAEGKYPLVYSQQFAINAMVKKLSVNDSGVYAVNGPPGTGKTTMLRDLIAHIIVERAKVIASFSKPGDGFKKQKNAWKSGNTDSKYFPLNPKLFGYEIVVASSNNGAVENVTMEIPAQESVDKAWLPDIDYYKEIGDEIIGTNSWGLGAAKLGNSSNKSTFVSQFIYDTTEEVKKLNEETGVMESHSVVTKVGFRNLMNKAMKNGPTVPFFKAKKEFLSALNIVEEMKKEKEDLISTYEYAKGQISTMASRGEVLEKEYVVLSHTLTKSKNMLLELQNNNEEFEALNQKLNAKKTSIDQDMEKLSLDMENMLMSNKETISKIKVKKSFFFKILHWFKKDEGESIDMLEQKYEKGIITIEKIQKEKKMLFSSQEERENDIASIRNKLKEAEKKLQREIKVIEEAEQSVKEVRIAIEKNQSEQKVLRSELEAATQTLHNQKWDTKDPSEREKSSPLTSDALFQEARTRVFIKALALQKSFIESNAGKFKFNLSRIQEILENKVSNADGNPAIEYAVRDLWASLFLCVPVVSSTFASFSRLFPQLWKEKLGWLLIDEAGQAVAKAAVGALKRMERIVVVGDPLQLEPIVGLPGTIQESLRRDYGAPDEMLSVHTSVQKRADALQPWGTYLGLGETPTWVGSPLRVHRRCHSPMFEISNLTTYGEMMIQGKEKDKSTITKSQWIDVLSTSNSGHWIPEEGEAVKEMVERLNGEGIANEDIYLISPFRDVVNGLSRMFKGTGLKVGTIHTVQGKEAKAVFVVLGSDPQNEGARDWASEKPNLLNVAVTRAKDRVFIVGNKQKWANKEYFDVAVDCLQ